MSRYGRVPGDDELAALRKQDVAAFPPTVQFRYQRELEPPDASEGFSQIEVAPFERRILLIHRYQLDSARCIYVGAGSQDPGFARKLGFTYRDSSAFF